MLSTEAEFFRYFLSPLALWERGRGVRENTAEFLLRYLSLMEYQNLGSPEIWVILTDAIPRRDGICEFPLYFMITKFSRHLTRAQITIWILLTKSEDLDSNAVTFLNLMALRLRGW